MRAACAFVVTAALAAAPVFAEAPNEADLVSAKKAFSEGLYELARSRLESFIRSNPPAADLYEAHALLGRAYYKENNLARAGDEFEVVLGGPAGGAFRDDALYWSGEVALKGADAKLSLERYQRLIDEFPSSRYTPYAVYSKAWAYYKMGLLDEAAAYFRNVAAKYPLEDIGMDARFRSGECEYLAGRFDGASSEMDRYISDYPVSRKVPDACFMAGEARFRRGEYAAAIPLLERAIAVGPGAKWAALAHYRLGRSYLEAGDSARCEAAFKRCMDLAADDTLAVYAMIGRAMLHEKDGDLQGATGLYAEAASRYPGNPAAAEAAYRQSRLLYLQKKYDEADRVCRDALQKFPASHYADDIRAVMGRIYAATGRPDEAFSEFEAIQKGSKDAAALAAALCGSGDIYFSRKSYDKAMAKYDAVLDRYSDAGWSDYAQFRIGSIFLLTARYDQAILALRSVILNFPSSPLVADAVFQLGLAYLARHDFEKARSEFSEYLQRYPASEGADSSRLFLGDALYHSGLYRDALRSYRELSAGAPEDLRQSALYGAAQALAKAGDEASAKASLEEMAKLYPSSDEAVAALFWLGERYRASGEIEKAKGYFASVIKDHPSSDLAGESLCELASIAIDEGRPKEAEVRLADLSSKYPGSLSGRAPYRALARMARESADMAGAIGYLRRSLTRDDDELNAQTQYEIAELYELSGMPQEAAAEYLGVSEHYGSGKFWAVRADLRAAQIFESLGRRGEAAGLYRKLAFMDVQESEFAKKKLAEMGEAVKKADRR